jgi:FRG domain
MAMVTTWVCAKLPAAMSDKKQRPEYVGAEVVTDIGNSDVSVELRIASTGLFGVLFAPDSLAEFTSLIQWEWLGPGGLTAWRGQADIDWPLHSGAHRRLLHAPQGWVLDDSDTLERALVEYEDKLLNSARMAGHGHTGTRDLDDLELLARLQHHGAATRIVDFSSSAIIALWFACRSNPDKWGVVFCANLDAGKHMKTQEDVRRAITTTRADARNTLFYWYPSALSPRIPAQAGMFVWSRACGGCDWTSLGGGQDDPRWQGSTSNLDPEFAAIAISPELKNALRLRWNDLLGLSEERAFPDFDGFATAHGATQPLPPSFYG